MRTTAIEAAAARGWTKAELQRRTGLSLSTIYNLAKGEYDTISGKSVTAIMAAFPDLPYERLFLPVDSSRVQKQDTSLEAAA